MERLSLLPDHDEAALSSALEAGFTLVLGPSQTLTATYLDTFDWRLSGNGLVLVEERGHGRRLVLREAAREPHVIPVSTTPRLAADLPYGHLRETLAPAIDIRALLPVGATWINRRAGRVQDAAGNLVARVWIEEIEALDRAGKPTGTIGPTLRLSGSTAASVFSDKLQLSALPDHDLESAAAARGRAPGDYSSKLAIRLEPEQEADEAIRRILLHLLATAEANIEGTILDHDTEFLHDFRVACRRTRSALTQLKGVLPPETVAPFNDEFKWLGSVTGPLRDLDVYLLEMPTYRSMLPTESAADLDPLESLIESSRSKAHREVVRFLKSRRFRSLFEKWRELLESSAPSDAPGARRPIVELAARRIDAANRRILKRGKKLGEDPPAEALHRLRIDAKKLRYLLEFFRSLYPEKEITSRIQELKRFQDILGGFNDMEVQRGRLVDFARRLRGDPAVDAECLLALGRLAGTLEQRQEGFRLAFHDSFVEFSGDPVQRAYHRLFDGKESS